MSFDPKRVVIRNQVDENGKPAGGIAKINGDGYAVASMQFQDGPLGRGPDLEFDTRARARRHRAKDRARGIAGRVEKVVLRRGRR